MAEKPSLKARGLWPVSVDDWVIVGLILLWSAIVVALAIGYWLRYPMRPNL